MEAGACPPVTNGPDSASRESACAFEQRLSSATKAEATSSSGANPLGPMLEQACRETFRELARIASEPESAGSNSIECIVQQVSTRLLQEAGHRVNGHSSSSGTSPVHRPAADVSSANGLRSAPAPPLLRDIVGTPWIIWREKRPLSGLIIDGVSTSITRQTSGISTECEVEDESAPGNAAISVEGQEVAKASLEEDASPPKRRASSQEPGMHHRTVTGIGHTSASAEKPAVCRKGLTIQTNTMHSLQMKWQGRPRACLIVIKRGDDLAKDTMVEVAGFLTTQGMIIVLEPQLLKDHPDIKRKLPGVRTFSEADRLERSIDLVITIGGDGTLTWAVNLFQRGMPPVVAFAAGSLGFLTPFPLDSWIRTLTGLLDLHSEPRPQRLVCRMRLCVSVRRRASSGERTDVQAVQCLNEVLVHRGASGSLVKLNVGIDGEKVTLVQGDGLILATPTGSTAYSLAAGGSMVHPSVPGILLTPVSPHSLSFRPALLPDSAHITVGVPLNARCGAAVSVDGKDLCTLKLGDSVEVSMSSFAVPTICHTTETKDWFSSVQSGLQWNTRTEQKAS